MDKLQQWSEHFASLYKRTPEGDLVMDESKFTEQTARSMIELVPDLARMSFTIHERVAQFGAFGLYRMSVTVGGETTEGQDYSIFLGDVSVPQTVASLDKIENATYLGGVARDKAMRDDMIAYLRARQERERRFLDRHAEGNDEGSRFAQAQSADDSARLTRILDAQAEEREKTYAKVQAALDDLKT